MPLLSPQPASQTALPTTADPLAHHHTHLSHPELWVGKGGGRIGEKEWREREGRQEGGEGLEEGRKSREERRGNGGSHLQFTQLYKMVIVINQC